MPKNAFLACFFKFFPAAQKFFPNQGLLSALGELAKKSICSTYRKRSTNITRPNCALDRSTILCLSVPGFQRQVFKHVKILSERSKESKEQKKNKGSILVAESAYNAQNAQFGLVMKKGRPPPPLEEILDPPLV